MTRKYHMLGKVYQLNTVDSFEGDLLHKELSLYPIADENKTPDFVINYLFDLDPRNPVLRNPSQHNYFEDGFRLEMINVKVDFSFEGKNLKQIDFCIKQGSKPMALANKWFSYQYTNRKESIGYLFHELILVPSALFISDFTLVHASAVSDEGAILFGGTGGVGKTSLELEMCTTLNKSFFADDIVFANSEGMAFPNLSYPKIYGYNLVGNSDLKKKLFKDSGLLNKLHWHSRKAINPGFVRRRINPAELYNKVEVQPQKIKAFYVLIKDGAAKKPELSKTSVEEAAMLNRLVIETEYHVFYKHLLWDEFNSIVDAKETRLSYTELMNRIETNLVKALKNVDCYLVKIPIKIEHKEYLEQVGKLLSGNPKG
jgi:hypothetical protein